LLRVCFITGSDFIPFTLSRILRSTISIFI
jgi:hypothetical protein